MISKAEFIKQIIFEHPDTHRPYPIEIYMHENGSVFGVDACHLDKKFGANEAQIPDSLGEPGDIVILPEIPEI